MNHQFRKSMQGTPPFHHYDLPADVKNHPRFNYRDLMVDQDFLLLRFGEIHCRISYSTPHQNFKIVRPENIDQRAWHEIKEAGQQLVKQYVDWYTTTPAASLPTQLQSKFLFAQSVSQIESSETDTVLDTLEIRKTFHQQLSTSEDGEVITQSQNTDEYRQFNIDEYFLQHPQMLQHPFLYAMICGRVVPLIEDVPLLASFNCWQAFTIKRLFEAALRSEVANDLCRALIEANLCPQLIENNGYISYDIKSINTQHNREILLDLKHEQNIDLIVVGIFARESVRLDVDAPAADHIYDHLQPNTYRLYNNMLARIQQLRQTRLWHQYFYSRNNCRSAQHRNEYETRSNPQFKVCDDCCIECARRTFIANWVQHEQRVMHQQTSTATTRQNVSQKRPYESDNDALRYRTATLPPPQHQKEHQHQQYRPQQQQQQSQQQQYQHQYQQPNQQYSKKYRSAANNNFQDSF